MTLKRKNIYLALFASIIGVGAVFVWFFVNGVTEESDDGRTSIILNEDEKDYVLLEMRGLLEAVHTITVGLADNEMEDISSAAKKLGTGHTGKEPVSLITKLPLEFKMLGMATHGIFDEIALEAEGLGDPAIILDKLSDVLNNCTTCHAAYRFDVSR